jgi:hypothetical protein
LRPRWFVSMPDPFFIVPSSGKISYSHFLP